MPDISNKEYAFEKGIKISDLFVDPLVFPISVDSTYGRDSLDAIVKIREEFGEEIHITGGMSNVSFGIPMRSAINTVFLVLAIEAGAEECFNNEDFHEIHCDKKSIYSVKKKIKEKIANFISTEIEWIPNNKIVVSKDHVELANSFLEDLDNNEDVQNIYTNLKLVNN